MKNVLLLMAILASGLFATAQTTYYWVGSAPAANGNISTNSNWNTMQNGSGASRSSSTGASDILVFDGANLGGSTVVTGPVTVNANSSITCAQIKFTGNVTINMIRPTSGTSTVTISGEAGDDWLIEAGSTFNVPASTSGSIRFAMAASNTGKVNGNMSVLSTQQFRIDNTTGGSAGSLIFTAGSNFTTNITGSSSYAFGSSTQSTEKWVSFESGSHLYYAGGNSPHGSGSLFSAIDMKPGSNWHHQANNAGMSGNFFNRKNFGNIIVESGATLTASGPIFQVGNLTINSGGTFATSNSGPVSIVGNLVVDGSYAAPAAGFSELLFAGTTTQTISGSGTISTNLLTIGDNANVVMNKNIAVEQTATVYGKMNFTGNQLTGAANFRAEGAQVSGTGTAVTQTGAYQLSGNTGIATSWRGHRITGAGIPVNTVIAGFSSTGDTIYVSNALTASASGVAVSVSTSGATLATANANGFDPVTGSVAVTGTHTFDDDINYTINAATTSPFGVTTGSSNPNVRVGTATINAPVTVNKSIYVSQQLLLNGKVTLRPLDTLHLLSGASIAGAIGSSNYIATVYTTATGEQSFVQVDGISTATLIPIGTTGNYLPVTLTPATASDFRVTVFEGITTNGQVNGTPLTPAQKQSVVNAVWNINRLNGTGTSGLKIDWVTGLEGSTFTTLPNTDIGIIYNTGSSYSLPIGTGDNLANTATASISNFGSYSVGAVPPSVPFVFNPLPAKTYGDADFNGGATSLNTTQPIVYSSSNPAVATIVGNNIHIVSAGTTDITASQASDGFYPAASITRTLTVNKAMLTITADNKTRFEGQANPPLTITYSGFVLGETSAALTTLPVATTTATIASAPGTYPITVSGAASPNYAFTYVDGVLTVQAKQNQTITFNNLPAKNYGNADFSPGATSTNNTIPITYSSSNTAVATIVGNNIHITGAGTTQITASQAGNIGYFPAPDVTRTLTVSKVNLTIRVRDTSKVTGQPNPPFTITYTGFVLGETAANLLTPPVATTTATDISSPGYYPITLGGATSNNYNIIYTNGTLTVYPTGGTGLQHLNAYMSNSTTLTVRVYSPNPALGNIVLIDMAGRPLLRKNLFMPAGFISMDVPVAHLPSGIYTVTVKGDNVDLQKTIPILK